MSFFGPSRLVRPPELTEEQILSLFENRNIDSPRRMREGDIFRTEFMGQSFFVICHGRAGHVCRIGRMNEEETTFYSETIKEIIQ